MVDTVALYTYWRSSCSWRVRIALALKGIEFEARPIHLVKSGGEQNSDEYTKINPARAVPTLVIDGITISQSLAIIEYLDATRPEHPVIPRDPIHAAHARQIALVIAAETQPLQNLAVLGYVEKDVGGGAEKKAEWAKHWIAKGLTVVDELVKKYGGRFCVGDEVTIADVCLVPQMYNAVRWGVDTANYPNLVRICAELNEIPAFQTAHADAQPDKDA